MDWFNNLVRGGQNLGNQAINGASSIGRNLVRNVSNIQTPISTGNRAQPNQRLTIGDIASQIPSAVTQAQNATQLQRDTWASYKTPLTTNSSPADVRAWLLNPNNHEGEMAANSFGGTSKFAGEIGPLIKAGTDAKVMQSLDKLFGKGAPIGNDIVNGLKQATTGGQVHDLLAKAGSMIQMHQIPLDAATRNNVVGELTSVGEHGAAAKAAQAQTHGALIDSLHGTPLHPDTPVGPNVKPYSAPVAPVPTPDIPLSQMNPSNMAHAQATQAQHDINTINMNQLLKAKQDAVPHPMVSSGGLLQDRVQTIKDNAAKVKADNTPPINMDGAPNPAELKAMNENAVAPHDAQVLPNEPKPSTDAQAMKQRETRNNLKEMGTGSKQTGPINLDGMVPKRDPMLANETGSAHANQGATPKPIVPKVEPTDANFPKATQTSTPATLHRAYDANGNVTALTHTGTGETFTPSHDGSPMSNLKNELLHEQKNGSYGNKGRDVAIVHGDATGGRQGVLLARTQAVIDHINSTLTAAERTQLTHYTEGSLKASEVSSKVAQLGDQWKEIERIGALLNKEASPKSGEILNNTVNHVEHINLNPTGERGKLGLGKFSTKNSTQQGRQIIKLTPESAKGKTIFGNPEKLGMEKQANGTYIDKSGNIFHPSQATIHELNTNGFHYESDAGKIMASSFNKYAKTANNLKLGRNLTNGEHGANIIPRRPGEKTPPKGYRESHIPGMENHWMSKNYHGHLSTNSDYSKSGLYKGIETVGKGVGVITRGVNNLFFTLAPHFHAMVNEMPQALSTFGAGKGPVSVVKTGKLLGTTIESIAKKDANYYDWMREGGSTGHRMNGGIEQSLNSVWAKVKDAGGKINVPLRLGHVLTEQVGTTIRYAKAQELVQQGMSMRQAIRTVNRIQGDYGNMNRFEKEVVKNFVQFYPFFKHQVRSIGYNTVGAFAKPGTYAGSAVMAALTYGAYTAMNKGLEAATGNSNAEFRKGGGLGLIDDAMKAKDQIEGYTNKAGVKQPGTIPSIVTNRLIPVARQGIEQGTGKDLATNKPFDTSTNGRLAQAGKGIAEIQDSSNASSGKKSIAEIALNTNSVKLPHGQQTPAAPNLKGTAIGDMINTTGHDAKQTLDVATAYKDAGGNKLLAFQLLRANGDHSLDGFFSKPGNSILDPTSHDFQGFSNQNGSSVKVGKDLNKSLGGSSLTYMQMQKLGGSTNYDKFFKQNTQLDPTNPNFQGFKKAGASKSASAGVKLQNQRTSNAVYKAEKLAKPISLKHTSSVRIAGMKHASLRTKIATVPKLKFAKVTAAPRTKISLARLSKKA